LRTFRRFFFSPSAAGCDLLAVFFAAFAPESAFAGALEAVEAGALPAVEAGYGSHKYMISDQDIPDSLWVPFANLQAVQGMGL